MIGVFEYLVICVWAQGTPPAFAVRAGTEKMARSEPLPIYKQAIDLTISFEKIVSNFIRYH